MLNKEDLRQIGELFDQKFDKKFDEKFVVVKKEIVTEVVTEVVSQVGDMIEENILPQFDRIDARMDNFERRLDCTDGKVNAMVNILTDKHVFTQEEKAFIAS